MTASPIASECLPERSRGVAAYWLPGQTWTDDPFPNENELPGCLFLFGTNPGRLRGPGQGPASTTPQTCVPDRRRIHARWLPGPRTSDTVSDRIDKCKTLRGQPNSSNGCPKPRRAPRFPDQLELAVPEQHPDAATCWSSAPKGAQVEFRCTGRGCKMKLKRLHASSARVHSLLPYLPKNRLLRKGIELEIRVTAPLTLGELRPLHDPRDQAAVPGPLHLGQRPASQRCSS